MLGSLRLCLKTAGSSTAYIVEEIGQESVDQFSREEEAKGLRRSG